MIAESQVLQNGCIDPISNMRDSVSSGHLKHREEIWKNDARRSIFYEIWSIWMADETLAVSGVWYIFSIEIRTKEKSEK